MNREEIEQVRNAHISVRDEYGDLIAAICTLALERLDMEPRPIAEALKDGTKIWAFWGGEWFKTYWAKRDKFEGWQMPQGMVIKAYAPETWKPTHFLPLSSLPTPKDK
jgi:hypothetical protein